MYDALNVYVGYRMMWNINENSDKMIEEFFEKLYGPAKDYIIMFYTEMEMAYSNPNNKGGPDFKWDWETCWANTYPPEFVDKLMGYLKKALVNKFALSHTPGYSVFYKFLAVCHRTF